MSNMVAYDSTKRVRSVTQKNEKPSWLVVRRTSAIRSISITIVIVMGSVPQKVAISTAIRCCKVLTEV